MFLLGSCDFIEKHCDRMCVGVWHPAGGRVLLRGAGPGAQGQQLRRHPREPRAGRGVGQRPLPQRQVRRIQ